MFLFVTKVRGVGGVCARVLQRASLRAPLPFNNPQIKMTLVPPYGEYGFVKTTRNEMMKVKSRKSLVGRLLA